MEVYEEETSKPAKTKKFKLKSKLIKSLSNIVREGADMFAYRVAVFKESALYVGPPLLCHSRSISDDGYL